MKISKSGEFFRMTFYYITNCLAWSLFKIHEMTRIEFTIKGKYNIREMNASSYKISFMVFLDHFIAQPGHPKEFHSI